MGFIVFTLVDRVFVNDKGIMLTCFGLVILTDFDSGIPPRFALHGRMGGFKLYIPNDILPYFLFRYVAPKQNDMGFKATDFVPAHLNSTCKGGMFAFGT